MKAISLSVGMVTSLLVLSRVASADVPISDSHIVFSPYNWARSGSTYAQSANPGAYFKVGFTGTGIAVHIDTSPLDDAKIPGFQYPVVRYSVDGGPAVTRQLAPKQETIACAKGLTSGNHSVLLQYVSGYVFLDFWTPINVVRLTGFTLDPGAYLIAPTGADAPQNTKALFLGDSITNGDDDIATFKGGITNAVDTQDATLGYPVIVAAGLGSEYGVVAYGGASWDGNAADGHTPGLMKSWSMIDSLHSRLVDGKLSPIPDDIFMNMGENMGPNGDDVPELLTEIRKASSSKTNIFVIVPFSGRARGPLRAGFATYKIGAAKDKSTFFIDLGNNPYLLSKGPTMFSVDGQHPLAALHAQLGAALVQATSKLRHPARPN